MYLLRILLIGLVLFAGCISMPKEEQRKNIISYPSLQESVDQGLETPFFSVGDWAKPNWWEIFESKELSTLIEEALVKNPNLEAMREKIEFAKQTAVVVRAKLFPLIYFNVEDTWTHLSHDGLYRALNPDIALNNNLIDLSLSYRYEFDFWNKYRNQFKAALGREKAEEAEEALAVLVTTTALAQTYFALKTNLLKQKIYQNLFEVRKNLYELERLLNANCLVSKLDPILSEEHLEEARQFLDEIEEEIAVNKHLINILRGQGPDSPLAIDTSIPLLPKTLSIPKTLHLDLLSRRPDLMAQIWRVEAHAHEVGAAKADFFPNIDITALTGFQSTIASMIFNGKSLTYDAKPALHLPIFTAGAIRANMRAKKALFDEAVFDYNNLILESAKEIADLISLGKSVFFQKNAQEKIVKAAEERLELTLLRKQSGLDSSLEADQLREEVLWKQIEDAALLYDQYLVCIKLIKALGGGYNSEYSVPLKAQGAS